MLRFFASPPDQIANALRKANWRDLQFDTRNYIRELGQQDKQGITMAIRCMRLQHEMVLLEDEMPKALLEESVRTNKVIIRDRNLQELPWSLHLILSLYSYQSDSCTEILELLAKPSLMGANLLHVVLRGVFAAEASSWLEFISQMLERDVKNRAHNLRVIHAMLSQGELCLNGQSSYRPLDYLNLDDENQVQAYTDLLLKMAVFGLPRNAIEPLLYTQREEYKPKQQSLTASLTGLLIERAHLLPVHHLRSFIASGFLKDNEIAPFAKYKKEILQDVLRDTDQDRRRKYLADILEPGSPLGKLFNRHKASIGEKLSLNHGLLKEAHIAFLAARRPSDIEDDFVLIDRPAIPAIPETLFSHQRAEEQIQSARVPLCFENSSPKADLMQ